MVPTSSVKVELAPMTELNSMQKEAGPGMVIAGTSEWFVKKAQAYYHTQWVLAKRILSIELPLCHALTA